MQQPLVMSLYNGIRPLIHSTTLLLLETSWESLLATFRGNIRKNLDFHQDDEEACALSLGLLLSAVILGFAPQFPLLKASKCWSVGLLWGLLCVAGSAQGLLSARKSLSCTYSLDQQNSVWA